MTINVADPLALATLGMANTSAPVTTPADPGDITVARLSDTSVRITITNAAGTTNRIRYATVANAGDTWQDGGNRSGNGTIDLTVVGATDYYITMIRDNGVYSYPSNIVKMSTSVGSGTTMTAGLGFPALLRQTEADLSVPGEDRIVARYTLGPLNLTSAGLTRGSYLPANADRSIVASTWEIISVQEVAAKGEVPRHAMCVGRKVAVTW